MFYRFQFTSDLESISRIDSHTFFYEVCSVGLRGLPMPTNYDFPRSPRSQPRCHYGHVEATPRFLGFTIALGYGTSSDGNGFPMPRAVSTCYFSFSHSPVSCNYATSHVSLVSQASYCGRLVRYLIFKDGVLNPPVFDRSLAND